MPAAIIRNIQWSGMECRVTFASSYPGSRADLRLDPNRPFSSIAAATCRPGPVAEASLKVRNMIYAGASASVVVVDGLGNVVDEQLTTVGDEF
jgi:hypothetical protein